MEQAKHRNRPDMARLKKQAKRLMLTQMFTQKQIAEKVGVSEKTMSAWVKQYGWNARYNEGLEMEKGGLISQHMTGFVDVEGFANYLIDEDIKCFKTVLKHLADYILSLSP